MSNRSDKQIKLVTHNDIDGLFCAVLLQDQYGDRLLNIDNGLQSRIVFAQPHQIEKGLVDITEEDIITDLPYYGNPMLWFDHHRLNNVPEKFNGAYNPDSESAAKLVFKAFQDNWDPTDSNIQKYWLALNEVDRIDSGHLDPEDITNPTGLVLLDRSLSGKTDIKEFNYCIHLLSLMCTKEMDDVVNDPMVQKRAKQYLKEVATAKQYFVNSVVYREPHMMVFDMTKAHPMLRDQKHKFMQYIAFPDIPVSVRIFPNDKNTLRLKVGYNNLYGVAQAVDIGEMCKNLSNHFFTQCGGGGGGNRGAGGVVIPKYAYAEIIKYMSRVIEEKHPRCE